MTTGNGNGNGNGNVQVEEIDVEGSAGVFQTLADLEKEFAKVELDALRRKEFALRPLYTRRNALSSQIPNFWPSVLLNGPQEFQALLSETYIEPVAAITSLNIERYQIQSETEGEPRSLRFTFEFGKNGLFEDTKVVKEFEFVQRNDDGSGCLVSKPVTFKWTKKGKKTNNGLLDAAVELYKAEEAVRLKDGQSGKDLQVVDRESLWQHEKLLKKLEKAEQDEESTPSWLDWFGYRGPVGKKAEKENGEEDEKDSQGEGAGDVEDDLDGMLDVEIFPGGEEVAIALAEDLWPNVMEYFMASQQDPQDEDSDILEIEQAFDDDEEVPELLEVEEARPAKRQRKA